MAPFHRYLVTVLISLSGVAAVLQADATNPQPHWVFTVFGSEPMPALCFVPAPDEAPVPLVFYPTARSPRYHFAGPLPLHLLDAATGRVVAKARLSEDCPDALVILTPDAASSDGAPRYEVRVVDAAAERHPPGELFVMNASGLDLRGTINRRTIVLHDGAEELLNIGASARVNLRTPFQGKSYQAYADTIHLGPRDRAWLLLLPPYHRGSLEVQSRLLLDAPAPDLQPDSQ